MVDCGSDSLNLICRIAWGIAVFWPDSDDLPLLRLSSFHTSTGTHVVRKTMSISSIESVLQQMRSVSQAFQAGERGDAAAGAEATGGFAGELKKSLDRISGAQQQASSQAEAFELGKPGVALNDVMVDMQKAGIGFQMGLQVRNKVVAAYQEVMNMQA